MTPESDLAAAASTVLAANESRGVLETLQSGIAQLRLSGDAAEVFTVLALALVPLACEAYTVLLDREGEEDVRLEHSISAEAIVASVVVPISPGTTDRGRGYSGSLTLHLSDRHSGAESRLIGGLAVELGISIVERERLRSKAVNLEVALVSNREIGAAIGVLMMTYKCTSDQAFDRLRRASQQSHRKLAAIAQDVTRTGLLDVGSSEKGYLTTRTPCMLE